MLNKIIFYKKNYVVPFYTRLEIYLQTIMYSNFKKTMLGHDNLTDFILYI
jgi:hypothetical protein